MPAPHCSVVFGSADSVLRFIDPRKPGLQVVKELDELGTVDKNGPLTSFLASSARVPLGVQQRECRTDPLPGSEPHRTHRGCRFLIRLYCPARRANWPRAERLAGSRRRYPPNEGTLNMCVCVCVSKQFCPLFLSCVSELMFFVVVVFLHITISPLRIIISPVNWFCKKADQYLLNLFCF